MCRFVYFNFFMYKNGFKFTEMKKKQYDDERD